MGYKVKLTGPKIDEALLRSREISDRINGWIKLPSTQEQPMSLGEITSPGNYLIDHWTDGPDCDLVGPINVNVMVVNGADKIQVVQYLTNYFARKYDRNLSKYGDWFFEQTDAQVFIDPTEPPTPAEKTIWVDTTDPEQPYIKIFLNGEWKIIKPPTMMDINVYDPTGMKEDVFAYIDRVVEGANMETLEADFTEHINDETRHVTQDDKDSWNAKPTLDEVNAELAALETRLEAQVIGQAGDITELTNSLHTLLLQYKGMLEMHISDINIHPDTAKQAEWDSKAAGDHTHFCDGSVTIYADQIVGGVIDPSLIDPCAKEVVVKVPNEEAMKELTIEDCQNGDMIHQVDPQMIYYVVDESYLDADTWEEKQKAFKLFSAGVLVMKWDNIEDIPTTLGGYGITDCYTKHEIDTMLVPLSTIVNNYSSIMDSLADFGSYDSSSLFSAVQKASLKMDTLHTTHETLMSSMETILQLSEQLEDLLS